ncbi:hypothetical protein ACSBR1_002359 [Camellia fascicularis]
MNFRLSNIKGCYYCFVYKRESCSSVDSGELEPEALVDSGVAHRCGFDISFVDSTLDTTISSGEEIEMAEPKKVIWLDIRGFFDRTIDLSPGTMYEIVFVMRMIGGDEYYTHISNYTVTLVLILPGSKTQRNERLKGKRIEEWFEILVGEFIMSPENVEVLNSPWRNMVTGTVGLL